MVRGLIVAQLSVGSIPTCHPGFIKMQCECLRIGSECPHQAIYRKRLSSLHFEKQVYLCKFHYQVYRSLNVLSERFYLICG